MMKLERDRAVAQFNSTAVNYPSEVCLHQLFEAQVVRTPDAPAVMFEGDSLTYAELDGRANQLAHHLRALGVGPEVLVGVFMERSLEMVIALYGILKAGGAYVPIDPEYPRQRVAFMLDDTRVPVLLTQGRLLAALPAHPPKTICLDAEWAEISQRDSSRPSDGAAPGNLAYVIYTSGSTGRPKGVMNGHRAICNRLLWMQEAFRLTESDRVMQKTPFSFDVSVWEFFWPLLCGARLVVARPGGHRDSAYLVNLIVDESITTIHFVPSMLRLFLEHPDVGLCRSLKRVLCSGEVLSRDLQERFYARLGAELHNLYGPTEAAVDVTHWACEQGSDLPFVPIGRPIANTQIHVLDENLQPVPIGQPGELHIGGVQVARGYLNRPELTKSQFIPDPFSKEPGGRLYKTGDLACWLANGALRFLGRADHQVKIGGNRIELGEIEAVLASHPAVKQAVVLAREDEPDEQRLVAYLVAGPEWRRNAGQLRSYLEERLPAYMVPAAFVVLDAMPLSTNGKVDRSALRRPSSERPQLGSAYVAPRSRLERYLADIWSDILHLDRVGIHDRFFELGGTSIQAAEFINRLQKDLGENVYIVSLFEAPTIAQYAAFLEKDYASSLRTRIGFGSAREEGPFGGREGQKVDEGAVARMHECIPTTPRGGHQAKETRNPPAVFVLSPPRSGTTLLRVMLAGHPDLFTASELQLLGFERLRERRAAYSGKFSLWLEGTVRAIMQIRRCDADEATRMMEECERRDCTTFEFYRILQEWIGHRTLVDKSPSYALDLNALERAEDYFRDPLYIHLVRHPYAMVRSFENYHMDQVLFLRPHPFSSRQLGELVWLISQRTVLQFLRGVPKHRQCRVRFEDLVTRPQPVMEEICRTLRLAFHPDMVRPYDKIEQKMIDGIYEQSKPMGDTRFLEHGRINPEVAGAWEGVLADDFLSDITWALAASLGYERPTREAVACSARPEDRQSSRAERLTKRRLRRQQLRRGH